MGPQIKSIPLIPHLLGLRFLVLSPLYPHYTPILPPHPHDIPRVCLEIWYPNFFSWWIIVNSPSCHSWALWGPQRGCGYIPMYPLPQHGWKIARACRWASQLETSSGGIFQLAMVEYRRVSPLYPDIIRYPHYIPINPSHIPFWLWRILELHVFAQGSMTGVLEGCQSVIHLAADGRRVARKNHGDGAVTRSNHQK